jgi:hypothetical protein
MRAAAAASGLAQAAISRSTPSSSSGTPRRANDARTSARPRRAAIATVERHACSFDEVDEWIAHLTESGKWDTLAR